MARRVAAHITVLYEPVALDRLQAIAAATRPLRMRVTAARRWCEEPGIYMEVADVHDDLGRFRTAVLGTAVDAYEPHITLLHRDSVTVPAVFEAAWAALAGTTFDAELVLHELVAYDQTGIDATGERWAEVARLTLADL